MTDIPMPARASQNADEQMAWYAEQEEASDDIRARLSESVLGEFIRDTISTALVQGSGITLTKNDAGDTITIAASGSSSGLFINVKDHGALGNGTADDTTAVQAAITAATTGSVVYFPPGTYRLGNLTINGKTNVTFWAPGAIIKRIDSPTGPLFRIGQTTPCTNLRFDLAEIDGNNYAGGLVGGTIFRIDNVNGFRFDGYIHHTWNHAIHFSTAPTSNVDINIRAEFIGRGYTADTTFQANSPMGCGVYFATAAPVTNGRVRITGTDIKGAAAVYVGGCNGLIVHLAGVRRTGYRGLLCAGTGTVVGLKIPDMDVSECGAVYESDRATNHIRYGEGSNAVYTGTSPVTAQDAVIIGGKVRRTGENAVEGKCIIIGLVTEENGYAYTNFGSDLARDGLYLHSGSRASGVRVIAPARYGLNFFSSTFGLTDIILDGVIIDAPASKGMYFHQEGAFTASEIIIRNMTIRKGSASPTHGIHLAGVVGGSLAATCLIKGTVTVGTFSTAPVSATATGGGTTAAVIVETTSV